ncbi:MAG: S-layer protein, partial [Oscillatoriales cyanobacterium]
MVPVIWPQVPRRSGISMQSVFAGFTLLWLISTSAIAAIPSEFDPRVAVEPTPEPLAITPLGAADPVPVRDFVDVEPQDWAYQALQRLVSQYHCLDGDREGRFDGRRSLTRYEFAAGLHQCLQAIEARFTALDDAIAIEADTWQTIQALQRDFAAELADLTETTDALTTRLEQISDHQFSTTTVMGGEAIFSVVGAIGGDPPGEGDPSVTLNYLSRLGFVSSFTGRDRLRLELVAGNYSDRGLANPDRFNTDMALLSFQSDTDSSVRLSKLEYRTAIGDRLVVTVRPVGFSLSSVLTANSPYFDAGRGSLSRFAEANPIFKLGSLDAGVGIDWLLANNLRLQVAYGA